MKQNILQINVYLEYKHLHNWNYDDVNAKKVQNQINYLSILCFLLYFWQLSFDLTNTDPDNHAVHLTASLEAGYNAQGSQNRTFMLETIPIITGNTCNLTNLRQKRLEDTTASTKTKSTASSEVKN